MKALQLKNSILQYAMQGKLVEQDSNDESARLLIERIKRIKEQLIKDKVIKRVEPQDSIKREDYPYEIPANWEWVRVGEISLVGTGSTPYKVPEKKSKTDSISWVNSSLTSSLTISKTNNYITELAMKERNLKLYKKGSLVIALYGQGKTRGQVSELLIDATVNQACAVITEIDQDININPFIQKFFQKTYSEIRRLSSGGAQPNLNVQKIKDYLIPLPPLEEQKRIVLKIEELFKKVNEYDGLEKEITRLNDNFPVDLDRSILQYAIQGKLVEQDSNDEPACVLIERIKEEKEKLIKDKVINSEKLLSPLTDDEIPFEIPYSWEWVRLKDVIYNHGEKKPDKEFSYIDVASIDNNVGALSDNISIIKPENAPSRARKIIKEGSVLYSTVRPYLQNICIIDQEFEYEPIVSTAFAVMQPIGVTEKYLFYLLKSPYFNNVVESKMMGVAYPAINDRNLYSSPIPLPPLAEQKRIVAKIEEIRELTRRMNSY